MNRYSRSGGIKFREFSNKENTTDNLQEKKSIRSKKDVLQFLNKSSDDNTEDNKQIVKEPECKKTTVLADSSNNHSRLLDQSSSISNENTTQRTVSVDSNKKKVYNVLIGKISARKHKQWDSDGFLEVSGKSAVLKDEDGKYMGQLTLKEEVEEGSRMCIGGKEIEIVDLASLQSYENIVTSQAKLKEELVQPQVKQIKPSKPISHKRLKPTQDESIIDSTSSESSQSQEDAARTQRAYNVLIGKISARKHKQWDDDGLLIINGKNATLKDLNGKVLGNITIKDEAVEEGSRFCIGGKEIEIVDPADSSMHITESSESSQDQVQEKVITQPNKKIKISKGFIPVKTSGKSLHSNFEPLVMPPPSVDFKWSEDYEEAKQIHEVSVDSCLAMVLRPHQRQGLIFMYKCVSGMNNARFNGAILADEMGLGKTLQCISLIWTLLKKGPYGKPLLKRVIILAPSSLCGNWEKEFKRWLGTVRISPFVVDGKKKVKDFMKSARPMVMIISYEMFIRNFEEISSIGFDLLVCDEGHRLKNSEVKTLKLLNQLNCPKRLLLTGTPVQNDLQELYTLINFVNPGLLGSSSDYKEYYEKPIVASQVPDADEETLVLGRERAKELHEFTKKFILRRTNDLINKYLPQKHELVIFCKPMPEQENLYSMVTDYWFHRNLIADGHVMPLTAITALKKVCNHPFLMTSVKSNILDEIFPKVPTKLSSITASHKYSGKMMIVQAILNQLKSTSEKIVLVSYFTSTLDLLEKLCNAEGLQHCRLDGSTTSGSRTKIVDRFNSKDCGYRVFLLSAKAGGVGLNLVGASRLILFDSDWNPASDAQAMARIWRDGQKRSVYIYRLLTTGTIEEKIYQRQISKIGLSEAVVDPNQAASLKLSTSELKDLFTLESKTCSVTHDLMNCSCTGTGELVEKEESKLPSEDTRTCQFNLKKKETSQHLTINQLHSWQHYKPPINEDFMKELMISQVADLVTFIFKNSIEK